MTYWHGCQFAEQVQPFQLLKPSYLQPRFCFIFIFECGVEVSTS